MSKKKEKNSNYQKKTVSIRPYVSVLMTAYPASMVGLMAASLKVEAARNGIERVGIDRSFNVMIAAIAFLVLSCIFFCCTKKIKLGTMEIADDWGLFLSQMLVNIVILCAMFFFAGSAL